MVVCRGCKRSLPEDSFAKDRYRSTGRRYKCRECSAAEFKRWQSTPGYRQRLDRGRQSRAVLKETNPRLRWARAALSASRMRAKRAGLEHTLTLAWLLEAAADTCPLLETGLQYANDKSHVDSPAVDRIDNTRGYTPDNCWVISMLANRIKTNASVEQIEVLAANLRKRVDNTADELLKGAERARRAQ